MAVRGVAELSSDLDFSGATSREYTKARGAGQTGVTEPLAPICSPAGGLGSRLGSTGRDTQSLRWTSWTSRL
jgi:hypothetical protein